MPESCCTHENPPLIFWSPQPEQLAFHFRRFAMLTQYYRLVADTAHWWINHTDELMRQFPSVKFVGLVRDKYECAVSFARIKGIGRGSYNHWAAQPNRLWSASMWDPTYPTLETPEWADRDPDHAKWVMILRYIEFYNSRMASLASRNPDKYLILRTEMLDEGNSLDQLYGFIGTKPQKRNGSKRLNVKSTKDGRSGTFKI